MRSTASALILAALLGAATPALAQDLVLEDKDRRICLELAPGAGMDACQEYYDAKQAVMTRVRAAYTKALHQDPSDSEGLEESVSEDIFTLLDEMDVLYGVLETELDEDEWSEALPGAIRDEREYTYLAESYWSNECGVAVETVADVFTMNETSKQYEDKMVTLKELARFMDETHRDVEAANLTAIDPGERLVLCTNAGWALYRAKLLESTAHEMDDQLMAVLIKVTQDQSNRMQLMNADEEIRDKLPEDWGLRCDPEVFMRAQIEGFIRAREILKAQTAALEDGTYLAEFGAPFDDLEHDKIVDYFQDLADTVCLAP